MAGRALRVEKEKERTAANLEDRIRERAHEIYLARGGEGGSAMDDWLQAESELRPKESEEEDKEKPGIAARSSHRS
jgi:hypothetical protein